MQAAHALVAAAVDPETIGEEDPSDRRNPFSLTAASRPDHLTSGPPETMFFPVTGPRISQTGGNDASKAGIEIVAMGAQSARFRRTAPKHCPESGYHVACSPNGMCSVSVHYRGPYRISPAARPARRFVRPTPCPTGESRLVELRETEENAERVSVDFSPRC